MCFLPPAISGDGIRRSSRSLDTRAAFSPAFIGKACSRDNNGQKTAEDGPTAWSGGISPIVMQLLSMATGRSVSSMDIDAESDDLVIADYEDSVAALDHETDGPPRKKRKLDDVGSFEKNGVHVGSALRVKRNYRKVNFGLWQIEPSYHSSYPAPEVDDSVYAAFARLTPPPSAPGTRHGKSHSNEADDDDGFEHGAGSLWVCDRCFKYMRHAASYEVHAKKCNLCHPPGRKVYQRGAHTIWEVDGAKAKLYCQNLSLFGKLFIEVKTIYFDCEPFMFYLMTDADPKRDHVMGYFSKEKVSYDDHNLACIVTFPPYQKRGFGMLMIEFSYLLSKRAHVHGSPERPLSEMGVKSYLAFWVSESVRYMQRAFEANTSPGRRQLPERKFKRVKGWDGEVPVRKSVAPNGVTLGDPFAGKRIVHGSDMTARFTLDDISQATFLKANDIAIALSECGLLKRRRATDSGGTEIVISKADVDRVAQIYRVKNKLLDEAFVLL